MFITRKKYHKDISEAYTRGLEQGFELARKLKHGQESKRRESPYLANSSTTSQLVESSLLSRQLVDIARYRGINLE